MDIFIGFKVVDFDKCSIELDDISKCADDADHKAWIDPSPFFAPLFINDPRYRPGEESTKTVRDLYSLENNIQSVQKSFINTPRYFTNHQFI